jgi:carbamoyltransferase
MLILGLSALEHDSAAALLNEKGILAAIEESKLTRVPSEGGIPRSAIKFCLERAKARWGDLDCVAVASRPLRACSRETWFRAKGMLKVPVESVYSQTKAFGRLGRELNNFRILKSMMVNARPGKAAPMGRTSCNGRFLGLEHHLCHAASAFYASPFDQALILTLDEQGDGRTALAAVGEGNQIRVLRWADFPHSLGWLYSQVTALLGFLPHREEHKTQWLSLEGDPAFEKVFREIIVSGPSGLPHLDVTYFNRGMVGRIAFSSKFYRRLGIESEKTFEWKAALRPQVASSLQNACVHVVGDCIERLLKETGKGFVCLAGGVFLNSLLVAELERRFGAGRVFVQPVAGNAGSALGAAWWVWHQILRKPRLEATSTLDWGPSCSVEEIKAVLDNCMVRYCWQETEEDRVHGAATILEKNGILAWCQGAAEFGARALGHRSLLASPWMPYVKENLNKFVKHREPFRPFAISVPEEDCGRYFECSPLARFMATLGWVRPEGREFVKDFVLPGNRIRLCPVSRTGAPLLWQVLKEFGKRAPAPMLVHTSFNLFGEPLVITPRDAVRSFFCSGIDALLIDGFLVDKSWEVRLVVDPLQVKSLQAQ